MKILLDDGLQKSVGTGIGRYTETLFSLLSALPDTEVTREDFGTGQRARKRARLIYLRYLASRRYREKAAAFDVVHYTNYAMPRRLPRGVLSAVTVHDLTAFCHPETLPPLYAFYNRHMIRRAVARADLIFTVSEAVRAELAARFPAAAGKSVTVPPGLYREQVAAPAGNFEDPALSGLLPASYFLFIGTLETRKDPVTLLRAFRRFYRENKTRFGTFSLVLAGRPGRGYEEIEREVALAREEGADIRLPGYLSSADCARLYHRAAAFVFPSLYEGFGSPQTEAMSAGLPLLLSDIPTNREVSGDYGLYFPVGDGEALCALMEKVASDPQKDAGQRREKAAGVLARFDPLALAEKTRTAYEQAMKRTGKEKKK